LVLAFLRDMGKRGVPDAMRPLFVNLTAPTNAEERAVRGALDVWVDMVAGSGRGAGVLLAEGRGERQGTRHWHGLALTTVPERALAAWWCDHTQGTVINAQRIEAITTAYLPLGSPEMERDIRRVLAYALRQHAGSEIVVRGGLADCWRRAGAVAPVSVVPPSTTGPVEPTGEPGEKPPARASAKRAARGAAGGARTCAYCGESLEGLRRDARYCSRSCRNMASRKNVRSKGKAA
jgi:hypothetical protein